MKLRLIGLSVLLSLTLSMTAASDFDEQQEPFGFCTRTSRTDSGSQYAYRVTGGGCWQYPISGVDSSKVITLTSTGQDMKADIMEAISDYDVIVFDGSKGDFYISSIIELDSLRGKTLLGIHQARLCTSWYTKQEMIDALNDAGVPGMSTQKGTGGILTNGTKVGEEAEYNTRQMIINMTGDREEKYRYSGLFLFRDCRNLIIRNLKFVGPGSIDVGGSDLVSFAGTTNSWVDHCEFSDGMDGNFDITHQSDFNTVSWCIFFYTERSYMHQNTNLVGATDREAAGHLNTTYAFNHWGSNCRARMPMGRVGKIHVLNNYYTATTGGNCINPRKNAEFLIEGNYFEEGMNHCYGQKDAAAVTWCGDNRLPADVVVPSSFGIPVKVPYAYKVVDAEEIPTEVAKRAGATLFE